MSIVMDELLYGWLMEALEDDRVVQKLRKVLEVHAQDDSLQLREKVERLQDENRKLTKKVTSLQESLDVTKTERDTHLRNVETIGHMFNPYKDLNRIYDIYMDIKREFPETSKDLSGRIVCEDNPITFFYSISAKLDDLYDWIWNRFLSPNVPIEELAKIYNWFLDVYCSINGENYSVMHVEVGQPFDSMYHRGRESSHNATIHRVIVNGYISNVNKKVIKKSIVEALSC